MYHEIFDVYHPYIGDKATLYYLYLLRSRNNDADSRMYGKSWRGRRGITEKFALSYSTIPLLDAILVAAGLIEIEARPSGNGADKIYYTVHDPLSADDFARKEPELAKRIRALARGRPEVVGLLGKERGKAVVSTPA